MKKVYILERILILILIIIALISLSQLAITSNAILDSSDKYSYTTAICNKTNFCEDYLIECEDNNLKGFTQTGFSIQKDLNWIDSREKTTNFCK